MRKIKMAMLFFCLTGQIATAQNVEQVEPLPKHKMRFAIGLSSGTQGLFGADVAVHLLPSVNVRLAYHRTAGGQKGVKPDFAAYGFDELPNGKVGIDLNYDLSNTALTLEWAPGKKRKFRLQGGLVYAPNFGGNLTLRYLETIVIQNDFTISPDEVGYMKVTSSPKSGIMPYMGIGLGRAVPKKRVGLSLDMGAVYLNSPVIDVEATNLLRENEANEEPLNRNFADYKWLPVMNLRLAVRLN